MSDNRIIVEDKPKKGTVEAFVTSSTLETKTNLKIIVNTSYFNLR